MSAQDYYNGATANQHQAHGYGLRRPEDDRAPSLPPLQHSTALTMDDKHLHNHHPASPLSPAYDSTPLYPTHSRDSDFPYHQSSTSHDTTPVDFFENNNTSGAHSKPKRQYSDEIPLRDNPQHTTESKPNAQEAVYAQEEGRRPGRGQDGRRHRKKPREPPPKLSFWRRTTWVVYIMTLIQCSVFIAELVRNSLLTNTPIQIRPQFNPMIGPSFYVLVNMGARYQPCMKSLADDPDVPTNITWPCPSLTSVVKGTEGYAECSLSEFCGFADFGDSPNQWWRFIVPIFLHAGFIHIGFNMLLQLTLGREMEHTIGSIRFLVVYLASGIFGFVLGGNFAPNGIASTGASGSLFGLIAINLLDLLYTWNDRVSPKKELAFIILDIVISFVLGLLPGLDNFSHIGGFLMGLVLGVCLLHSPDLLRKERARPPSPVADGQTPKKPSKVRSRKVSYKSFIKDPVGFFKNRKLLWWSWWLIRAAALIGVLASFIVLINNFYTYNHKCDWCKYFTCIDVNNWCDQGDLANQAGQNARTLAIRGLEGFTKANLIPHMN